jgi:hypothetical protein
MDRRRYINYGLEEVIRLYNQNLCQDPRDKVFGLMGIVDKNERVVVDYNKTVYQVVADVVASLCASCERRNWKEWVDTSLLMSLCRNMGFQRHEILSLRNCVDAMWTPRTPPINRTIKTESAWTEWADDDMTPSAQYDWVRAAPIVAVGYQTAKEYGGTQNWWWFEDSTGTRSYHNCDPGN